MATHTIFYDGECGLCDRFVQMVLRRDHQDRFRFASLRGAYAQRVLAGHGIRLAPGDPLDTVYVLTAEGRLLDRDAAALFVFGQLDETRRLAGIARLIPGPLRNLGYRAVARTRYAFFGRADTCAVPGPESAGKFIPDSAPV